MRLSRFLILSHIFAGCAGLPAGELDSGEDATSDAAVSPDSDLSTIEDGGVSEDSDVACSRGPWLGDLEINTLSQAEDHYGYTSVTGSLSISGDVNDLESLSCLEEIGGDLRIDGTSSLRNLHGLNAIIAIHGNLEIGSPDDTYGRCTGNELLTSISGLERVDRVGGSLIVCRNGVLRDLVGLEDLHFVGEHLNVCDNDSLINLDGLDSLTSIGGYLHIGSYIDDYDLCGGNPVLENIDGLENLSSVGGDVTIFGNESLVQVDGLCGLVQINSYLRVVFNGLENVDGFVNLIEIRGSLFVAGNMNLADTDGFLGLSYIGGDLAIGADWRPLYSYAGNHSLENINGLINIQFVHGDLYVVDNVALSNLSGLREVSSIEGDVYIAGNDMIEDLRGLEGLREIEGVFSIGYLEYFGVPCCRGNYRLTTLSGLDSLWSIGQDLIIEYNNSLRNLDGLISLAFLGDELVVIDNEILPECEVDYLVEQLRLQGWEGEESVMGNYGEEPCI
ncbi:hypothetical protein KKC97_11630 [bacterium]|nr:hypothetical protein [bacterium]